MSQRGRKSAARQYFIGSHTGINRHLLRTDVSLYTAFAEIPDKDGPGAFEELFNKKVETGEIDRLMSLKQVQEFIFFWTERLQSHIPFPMHT